MNTFVATTGNGQVEVHQGTIPEPGPNDVVVKVSYSAISPFDFVDAAGVVAKVGSSVTDLKEGDRALMILSRVATFACKPPNGKALQEYTVVARTLVAQIPDSLSLEDASTLSGNFVTAFHTLFDRLELPWSEEYPKSPSGAEQKLDEPILVYGAGSSAGQYMVQLLGAAGYFQVIAVASSRHNELLRGSGAAHVIDYRSSSFTEEVSKAAGGERKIKLVVDCVSLDESFAAVSKVVSSGATVAFLGPMKRGGDISGKGAAFLFEAPKEVVDIFPDNVKILPVATFEFEKNQRLAEVLLPTILPRLLVHDAIRPNATLTFQEGSLLERVNSGLQVLRENRAGGKKVVIKVVD
ncbi:chaperonin 10-like protein [Coprinopsis sp. MPI-PUGE-AT-0042]|nr:chaperonin 10-like protein [Coprinopsis sp. MPI-PUGE-AT-0042]